MNELKQQIKAAVEQAGLETKSLSQRQYNGKKALKLRVPIFDDKGWNDAHREKLNNLCKALSDLGLRWAADLPHRNMLITNDKTGQPWMLFNGGETIDLVKA